MKRFNEIFKLNMLLILLSSILLVNCNQVKLDEIEAAELIRESQNLPANIKISLLSHSSNKEYFNLLQRSGLITWKYNWGEYWGGNLISTSYECDIFL